MLCCSSAFRPTITSRVCRSLRLHVDLLLWRRVGSVGDLLVGARRWLVLVQETTTTHPKTPKNKTPLNTFIHNHNLSVPASQQFIPIPVSISTVYISLDRPEISTLFDIFHAFFGSVLSEIGFCLDLFLFEGGGGIKKERKRVGR